MSQTQTEPGTPQYGFYAVPKALEPKRKYREVEEQSEEGEAELEHVYSPLDAQIEDNVAPDYYIDQAPYPEFKPRQRGLDFGVQIERGDLFDYALEVKPLVEILVGRSVVSALNELQEQREIKEKTKALEKYQHQRNAELMLTQRLEAKHTRKQEEAQRRKLQKDLFTKNQRQTAKKLIARKNAKQQLMSLKIDLLNELEESGPLRTTPVHDLRINYEEWLYENVMNYLSSESSSKKRVEKMISEEQKSILEEHQKHIANEIKRRKDILDEKQRLRKEAAARKEKKRIYKQRLALRKEREPELDRLTEQVDKYEQLPSLLKAAELSGGFARGERGVFLSGNLINYLLSVLRLRENRWQPEEIDKLLKKLLKGLTRALQIPLMAEHHEHIQNAIKRMEESKVQFMQNKQAEVQHLANSVRLDLSLLGFLNISIPVELHNSLVSAILNIILTIQVDFSEETPYEMTEADKRNLQLRNKIEIVREESSVLAKMRETKRVIRVRFEQAQEEEKQPEVGQWIDIYDGEGWSKMPQNKKPCQKEEQSGSIYVMPEGTFVYDERNLYYLQGELEKLLEIEEEQLAGKNNYQAELEKAVGKLGKEIPVYDVKLHWTS